jgi:thiol-disulfide isomerase/thioredoxin
VTARVRAPRLHGDGGWIGVGALDLAALRGRIVLLDFWTLACVNCLRVTEELRGLERRWADELLVIGVHSPKFPHEHDHEALRMAVARHRIEHPVLDDPALATWRQYAVRAWPTLVLVDPEGYEVARWSGEGHAVAVSRRVEELVAEHEARGTLVRGRLALDAIAAGTGELAFPGKVAARADGTLAIADTGHDRVLVCAPDGEVLAEHGGLYQPQGLRWSGQDLLVCETGADRVWRIAARGSLRALVTDWLASPWDVVVWRGHVVVAEAGRHRLWAIDAAGEAQVIAGSGGEGLFDGPALGAGLAQPSGLAVTRGDELAWVDAESSALRVLDRPAGTVRTLVGDGLFDWGAADGAAGRASMQHPLGLAAGDDGALWVADTFNGHLRVWREGHLWTVPVGAFDEPGGLDVLPDGTLVGRRLGQPPRPARRPGRATVDRLDVGRPGLGRRGRARGGRDARARRGRRPRGRARPARGGRRARPRGRRARPRARRGRSARAPARRGQLDGRGAARARGARARGDPGASGRITLELLAATCGPDACRLRRTQRAYDLVLT